MGRKRKSEKEGGGHGGDWVTFLKRDSVRGVLGILCLAIAVFLVLATFGFGGVIGAILYQKLTELVGVGYFLIPVSFIMGMVIFFRTLAGGGALNAWRLGSMVVFLFSSLGLVNVIMPGRGGVLGNFVSRPLVAGIDIPATVTFLVAFISASVVVAFNVHPIELYYRVREWLAERKTHEGLEEDVEGADDIEVSGIATITDPEQPEKMRSVEAEKSLRQPTVQSFDDARKYDTKGDVHAMTIARFGGTYTPPPLSLLSKNRGKPEVGDIKANANIIKRTLQNFGIEVEMDEVSIGPTVTRYAMKPAEGVKLSKILGLQSNLELALAASPVRIEAPIPGKSLVGIEVPNFSRTTLGLAPLLSDSSYTESDKTLLFGLGRSITGAAHFADLGKAPHVLIAGATGSGKSVMIHDLILSLIYRQGPDRLRLVMIDPKRVELTLYNSIPHLLTPVITDPKRAILALKALSKEMERRYNIFETLRVQNIQSYHDNILAPALNDPPEDEEAVPEPMPYIVIIIDELADIMQTYPRELEAGVVRLAQMSRAVGIHLVLSTQRPSVKVLTGLIKANIPTRIAFQVASQIDSRTILDMGGAEKLLGAGDMLYLSGEMSKPRRIQTPHVTEHEVKHVAKYLASNYAHKLTDEMDLDAMSKDGGDLIFSSSFSDNGVDDDLYEEAKAAVMEAGKASTSYLQRKLRIGYARAARLMDLLEERGVIGPADGARPRGVLYNDGAVAKRADGDAEDEET